MKSKWLESQNFIRLKMAKGSDKSAPVSKKSKKGSSDQSSLSLEESLLLGPSKPKLATKPKLRREAGSKKSGASLASSKLSNELGNVLDLLAGQN